MILIKEIMIVIIEKTGRLLSALAGFCLTIFLGIILTIIA